MSALHPVIAQALAPFVKPVNPFRRPTGTRLVSLALQDWYMPGHQDLSNVLFDLAAAVKGNDVLTGKCRRSVVDALLELADEVDQDLVNQQAGDGSKS